jgi:hypothetical protein
VFLRFCCRASTARHGQAGSVTPDCLLARLLLVPSRYFSIQCLTCSHIINNTPSVRFSPRHFFAAPARTASLGETGRSVTPRGTAEHLSENETSKPDTATNVTQHCI